MKLPVDGSAPVTLASGADRALGIAVDGTSVYWTDERSNSVLKVSAEGGSVTTLASEQNMPWSIAVDANSVYWTNFGSLDYPGSLLKITPK